MKPQAADLTTENTENMEEFSPAKSLPACPRRLVPQESSLKHPKQDFSRTILLSGLDNRLGRLIELENLVNRSV